MSTGKETGYAGEKTAMEFLQRKGYELIERNYSYERAETDLIMKNEKEKLLVFVEVKTRRNKNFGEPEESVNQHKINQMIKSAEGFLLEHTEFENYEKRFDVISIYLDGKEKKIKHIQNAF